MKWTLSVNEENQYVEIITRGDVDKDGSLNMVKDIMTASSQKKIKKILIDHSNIDSVSGEPLEVYNRPKEFEKMGIIPGIKVAIVVKPEHEVFFCLFERLCRNRGFQFTIFLDHKSALDWLLES
jgi:hypothetical protein